MSSSSTIDNSCRSAASLVSAVTGMWWNGTPYVRARSAKSVWLDTIAATSICRVRVCQRNSRSLRQWPDFDTRINVRNLAPASCSCQVMPKPLATEPKAERSCSSVTVGSSVSKCTRMKNRVSRRSSNCCESTMLPECSTRKSIPRRRCLVGQDRRSSARTRQSLPEPFAPPSAASVLRGTQLRRSLRNPVQQYSTA